MDVEYIRDLKLIEYYDWPHKAVRDPLHPCHGPLPDLQGLMKSEDGLFQAALWDTGNQILVFLEWLHEEENDPLAPMLPIEKVYKIRGWTAQTYRWVVEGTMLKCHNRKLAITPSEGDETWKYQIYRQIMQESLQLVAIPVGLY